jgi:hypothetical protein
MLINEGERQTQMAYTAILALFIGVIHHILFYQSDIGISYPIFVVVLYAYLFWGLRRQLRSGLDLEFMLLVPIFLLSLTFLIFANQMLLTLNFLLIPLLIVAQTMRMGELKRHLGLPFRYFGALIKQMFARGFLYFPQPLLLFIHMLQKRTVNSKNKSLFKIGLGLLLALPLLIVVVSLLASADSIFQELIYGWQKLFYSINVGSFIFRMIWIIVVSSILFSYLWSIKYPRVLHVNEEAEKKPISLDITVALTILVVVNAVYLLFTIVQFSYFFAAGNGILPDGTNYAEYARRGFAELVLVTMINFSLLMGGIHWVKTKGSLHIVLFLKVLLSILVGSTIVMLISAHLRLSLYEEAYGYTITRILVHAFMLFLGVLLLLSFVRVWVDRLHLMKPFIAATLVAWVLINYVNIDVIIVKNNLQRYTQSGKIDLYYLDTLSYDTVPVLVRYNEAALKKPEGLQKLLQDKKSELTHQNHDWQAFNLAQYRAMEAIKYVKQ